MRNFYLILLLLSITFASCFANDKWFVIIHENANADVVKQIPEYAEFAKKGTYFSNFHALTNPSQPNYIGLIAGDTFQPPLYKDHTVNFPNEDHPEANSTIIDLIEEKGLSWKVYLENYPSPGFTGDSNLTIDTYSVVNDFAITSGKAVGNYPANYAMFGPQKSFPEAQLIATANLDGTPEHDQDFAGKIVLISREGLSPSEKVKNAERFGAIGALIFNTPKVRDHLLKVDFFIQMVRSMQFLSPHLASPILTDSIFSRNCA